MSEAILTAEQLRDAGFGDYELALFVEMFGESTVVTVEWADSVFDKFSWGWVWRLLDSEGYDEYERAITRVMAQYFSVITAASVECMRDKASPFAEYKRASAKAWALAYIATCERRQSCTTILK